MPALSEKETLETIGLSLPGAATERSWTASSRQGRGSATGGAGFLAVILQISRSRATLARGDELLPAAERDLDRRECATHHDRGGDHDAARCLVGDNEIGTDPEHARLQDIAQDLGARAQIRMHIGRADVLAQVMLVDLRPARAKALHHAECANDFG